MLRQFAIGMSIVLVFLYVAPANSADLNFGFPVALNSNAATDEEDDWYPQIIPDGRGTWIAVWNSRDSLGDTLGTDHDILFSRSVDNGITWSDVVPLNINAATDTGNDTNPQVATNGQGTWIAIWQTTEPVPPRPVGSYNIFLSHSIDNAVTWSFPVCLNSDLTTGRDENPQIATDGQGTWIAAWEATGGYGGTVGTDWDIFFSVLTPEALNWTEMAPLNINAVSDTAKDYRVQLETDRQGTWLAVWEASDSPSSPLGTDDDLLMARSTNAGQSWSFPQPLNSNAETDSGNDEEVRIATDGQGNWVVVWQSNEDPDGALGIDMDIFVSRSSDGGVTWTDPIALNTTAEADSHAGISDYSPDVATDGQGTWLTVWDTWNSLDNTIGTDHDIVVSRSEDGGASWSDPMGLAANAATDSGWDQNPRVATDNRGLWLAVWVSRDKLGGSLGTDTDWDLFVSRAGSSEILDAEGLLQFLKEWSDGTGDLSGDGVIDYQDVFLLQTMWQGPPSK